MKEAIGMVLESIYDLEFPDTSHFRSGRGFHSVLRRIKEEWGTSRGFLEFNIGKCFHTIDRHRLIPIFKEEIDDPKFFYPIRKVFYAERLVGGEKGPYSIPHGVLLSALPGNIYLHKLDREIGRIRRSTKFRLFERIRSVLLRTVVLMTKKSLPKKQASTLPKTTSHHCGEVKEHPTQSAPPARGDQKTPFIFHPSSALAAFLNKPSSLLCAAFFIEAAGFTRKSEFYGRDRCNNNWAMRDSLLYCKRKGPPIEPGGEAILVIGNTKTYRPLPTIGLNLWVDSAGSTTIAARSTVEFLGTVIREVPPRETPIQFLREPEKRLRVKHRIHITFRNLGNSIPIKEPTKGMSGRGSLLDAVQLAETLGTLDTYGKDQGRSRCCIARRSKVPSDVQRVVSRSGTHAPTLSLYTPAGRKAAGEGGGHRARSIGGEFPIQIEAPIKKILRRLRDRGLISRRRPRPIHVAFLTNVGDGDIVNWSAGITISPLSYYVCCDNLYQVRTIVDHRIRGTEIFTPAHKNKSSARNIILKYSKDSNIVNKEGGKTLAEFPNSIELGKLGSGQDPNNNEHSTTSKRGES
ncbi:unnamed protein product [Withania somnifera]